ncbi:DNA mismatch repair endonuclease MutL [Enterobacteriaceae endosymbiont of Macroplea appendiculata]|uniref:DNA mismatch repair endonuclease MutL n=1 Tax=Enterobacteriaceae endosymbiont of Macroplea appendiculata TaxID=2675790 RepID=UPI001448D004|nr:DNA mismatch repair endonuclease MutL [Enterobacteriaceae endosymbiont of Macroplea appendiculata]QJC30796.1 hypothetical protein GJT86_00875 [Enterobacteriaceae endosymbiont of Macroplea appendiculata]
MSSIQILSLEIINKIAAGEVINRPASIIKELVENSIDAQSSYIKVNVEKGGLKTIKVYDNGLGMNKNDLLLCLQKYTTSKIKNIDDLDNIYTLGFRGEALASIRMVSQIEIRSNICTQLVGWKLYTRDIGSRKIFINPIAHPRGTTVIVSNLFYNIPVKKNFFSNEQVEFFHIKNIIKSIILISLNIHIIFYYNNKIIYNFEKVTNNLSYIKRIKIICGKECLYNQLNIYHQLHNMKLYGFLSLNTKKSIKYIYVNKRIIYNKFIIRTIKSVLLQNNIISEQYSYVMYFNIQSKNININIHPQKTDILFYNIEYIYDLILQSILKIISNKKKIISKKSTLKKTEYFTSHDLENIFINQNINQITKNSLDKISKRDLVFLEIKPVYHFKNFGKFLLIINNMYLIITQKNILYKLVIKDIVTLFFYNIFNKNLIELDVCKQLYNSIVTIPLSNHEYLLFTKIKPYLVKLGFVFQKNNIVLFQIDIIACPIFLIKISVKNLLINLLDYISIQTVFTCNTIKFWMLTYIYFNNKIWQYDDIINLLIAYEILMTDISMHFIKKLFLPIKI